MGGQAAEQIIAGVVLSERLAVTMYGAVHRAQFNGQRNLRGLVIDPKLLEEDSFRSALLDSKWTKKVTGLDHANILTTSTVEDGGMGEIVVVTRGGGRYVTVQDLITESKAQRSAGGRLPLPVAAAIGKAVVEALATAHKAGIVHGAVHPRSVIIEEDGTVRLADFIVGHALSTAVAQGADSALWRGLTGYLAPELVIGEEPGTQSDVFACGALLFTMLTGEIPPGSLHCTPAVERLVMRALDTDVGRRYRNASELLENLVEAFEDDRWEIAERGEIIKAAGLSKTDENIDDATEDLLASLGSNAVNVAPTRPSAEARAAEHARAQSQSTNASLVGGKSPGTGGRLDALLADLDDSREMTAVDDMGFGNTSSARRDPISELISMDPRKREAIVQARSIGRVPSLDDPDEDDNDTPLPAPAPDLSGGQAELEAFDAISELDEPQTKGATPSTTKRPASEPAGRRKASEPAPKRKPSEPEIATPRPVARTPIAETPDFDVPPPRIKSRVPGIIGLVLAIGGAIGIYYVYSDQSKKNDEIAEKHQKDLDDAAAKTKKLQLAQKDKGSIKYTITPAEASVWLKLGRSGPDFQTMPLTSSQMHRIRIELDGYQPLDTEVLAANWTGEGENRKATVNITLKAVGKDKNGKSLAEPLPALPPNLAIDPTKDFKPGEGPINIQTSPPGAEVWLLIGYGNTGQPFPTIAGRSYELRALLDGYKPGFAAVTDEEWRDGGDKRTPIDEAPKKATIEKTINLVEDPDAPKPDKKKPKGK
ncbi:MAG TPA: protein kinase [Kofleriaceae bacterium]